MKYDAIIIGSGVSGMTAGLILAKSGLRVIVLEQHRIPGGLMQSFKRGGMTFPTGVHRLGALEEGQVLRRYFEYLGVLDDLRLVPMDEDGFEEYVFPGMRLGVPKGAENFRERLISLFPGEEKAIRAYFAAMAASVEGFGFYTLSGDFTGGNMDGSLSLTALLDGLGCSQPLKSVLTAANPLYGLHPDHCPAETHFLVMDSFLQSSFRVDEKRAPMGAVFAAALEKRGGELRCGALVEEILAEERSARGVRLKGGEVLRGDLVIHTGHPGSLLTLCGEKEFRPVFRNRLRESENTPGAFGVAMTFRGGACPLGGRDAYIYESMDTGAQYTERQPELTGWPHMVYCSALPGEGGRHAVTAMATVPGGTFGPPEGGGARTSEYDGLKERLGEKIRSLMEARLPELKGRLKVEDTYTPVTFEEYTLAPGGTAYGIRKCTTSFRRSRFLPATRVRGLMLAGQSIFLPGILGALTSAVVTCSVLPGQEGLMTKIVEETR